MKKAIALFICLGGLVLAVEAATEWRVKPYGLLDMRNTLSVKVRAGTFCEPEVVYRSSTGKIGYHYVTITDAFGSKAKALVECESHTVADPVPPPVPAPPLVKPLVSENFDDNARYRQGSYQSALEFTQEATLRVMENTADFVEEFIEHTGTRH